jgi:hypothetical protein
VEDDASQIVQGQAPAGAGIAMKGWVMSVEPHANGAHLPEGGCCACCPVVAPSAGAVPTAPRGLARQADRSSTLIRLVLMALSAGGVILAIGLWIGGYGQFSARLLAADVLLAVGVLLL